MALRNRSSSISGAEQRFALCAIALTALACQRRAPQDEATGEAPSARAPEAAPAATASAAPAPKRTHKLGETADAPDFSVTLHEVKLCETTQIAPKPGNVRLGVRLTIEGRTEREVPVNPFYARLVDQQRDGYAYAATFGGCEPDLKSARVKKGDRMSGWITFELPKQASGLELSYSPYVLGSSEQSVKYDLGL